MICSHIKTSGHVTHLQLASTEGKMEVKCLQQIQQYFRKLLGCCYKTQCETQNTAGPAINIAEVCKEKQALLFCPRDSWMLSVNTLLHPAELITPPSTTREVHAVEEAWEPKRQGHLFLAYHHISLSSFDILLNQLLQYLSYSCSSVCWTSKKP